MLINRLLKTCARRHFEARQRPEAPEWWPKVCITHLRACKQVLAKNNSRTKPSNIAKFTPWLIFSQISLSQKNHYKMKIIPIVSPKAESPKKRRGKPGTLTGVRPWVDLDKLQLHWNLLRYSYVSRCMIYECI